jgi:hypothetical protein
VVLDTADQSSLSSGPNSDADSFCFNQEQLLSLMGGPQAELEDLLDGLTVWAHNRYGAEEIVKARDQFQLETGKIFPEDLVHLSRNAYFFDFFLFERSIDKEESMNGHLLASTPYEVFCSVLEMSHVPKLEIVERLRRLGDFRHSLFLIDRVHPQGLVVKDLISRQKILVSAKAQESFRALRRSQVIQGFLFHIGENFQLSPGIILHPPSASKILQRYIRLIEKEHIVGRIRLLTKLAYINVKYIRLKHVDPKITYKSEMAGFLSSLHASDA